MNWSALFLVGVVVAAFLVYSRSGLISIKDAQAALKKGALVIDVRSAQEFVAGHLPVAVNLPVNEIESNWSRRITDKDKILLLHCQSGMRSAEAKKKLNALGFANAFNMGSYARAERIVGGK